jgi:hypothetical protein
LPVEKIVDQVAGVEELGDGRVDVLLGFAEGVGAFGDLGIILVIEVHVLSSVRTIIVHPVVTAFPVFMSENLYIHPTCQSYCVQLRRAEY